ncbi:MAG: DUF962 domain-containing protein [Bacteroidia bacterium]|jgi:hypothetical protein|nr:DUF962 domain-containing protein [Bacteroidia bacterium]
MANKINDFKTFYTYYLSEHQDTTCRVLHFIGTTLFFIFVLIALLKQNLWWLIGCPLSGYGFAWVGHFFFEKNKPATFTYPLYSLASDFVLYYHLIIGKQRFKANG